MKKQYGAIFTVLLFLFGEVPGWHRFYICFINEKPKITIYGNNVQHPDKERR
jgi:hypothetical protein